MRKVFCMLLALTMMFPMLPAMAENAVIGSADGLTGIEINPFGELKLGEDLIEDAVAAGRRVISTLKINELSGLELDTPEMEQALADLLSMLTLTDAEQGDESILTLSIGDQEILDLGIAMAGKDTYIQSELIGGTVVVSEDEAQGVLDRLITLMVQYGLMTETDAKSIRFIMDELPAMMEEAMAQSNPMDNAMEKLASLDYTALAPLEDLAESRFHTVESPVVPRNCDPVAAGVQWVFTEDDVKQAALGVLQFIQDNPEVQELVSTWLGLPTEEQLASTWESYGELYIKYGWYESKEAYYAVNPTLQSILEQVQAELPEMKVMEGDYVVSGYVDENGELVYFAADVTFCEEAGLELNDAGEAVEVPASTMPISVTCTRQTLADGVYYVCNISVDGETLSIACQSAENSTILTMDAVEADGTIIKLADLVVTEKPGATENDPNGLTVELDIYNGDDSLVAQLLLEGESLSTETRSYLSGKLELKDCTTDTAIMSVSAMCDYTINGVDFEGPAKIRVEMAPLAFEMEAVISTADPVDSIMIGQVTRLAELDDAAFGTWFNGVINGMNAVMVNVLNAVPADILQNLGAFQ